MSRFDAARSQRDMRHRFFLAASLATTLGCSLSHPTPSEAPDSAVPSVPESDAGASLPECPLVELHDTIQRNVASPEGLQSCLPAGMEVVRCEMTETARRGASCAERPGRTTTGPDTCRIEDRLVRALASSDRCGGVPAVALDGDEVVSGETYSLDCVLRPAEGCR